MDTTVMISTLGTLVQAVATIISIEVAIFILVLSQQNLNLRKINNKQFILHKLSIIITLLVGLYILFVFLSPTFEFNIAFSLYLIFILMLIRLIFLKKDDYKINFRYHLISAVTISTFILTLVGVKIIFEAISVTPKPDLSDIQFWDIIKDGRIFFAIFLSYTLMLVFFIFGDKVLSKEEPEKTKKTSSTD